jgi:hypothetical protein
MRSPARFRLFALPLALAICSTTLLFAAASEPIALGSRRELFVDEFLISQKSGLELRLHHSKPREVVMVRDAPWEGSGSWFETIIRDGPLLRLYYTAGQLTNAEATTFQASELVPGTRLAYACYAESKDGLHWTKPELGLYEFAGSRKNNIVWDQPNFDNFTPFKDPNPACRPGEEYKAVAAGKGGLFALKSPDAIHWSYLQERPIITKGRFDSQNNAFWDSERQHYWCYFRAKFNSEGRQASKAEIASSLRVIMVSTSPDFLNWSEPELLQYPGAPTEALYTNVIRPYDRAPHLFLGFPMRYNDRNFTPAAMAALPDPRHREGRMVFSHRFGSVVTDGLFMSSRDGRVFHRWDEAFHRPGPQRRDNWVYGDGAQSIGMLETPAEDPSAEPELSLFVHENHWKGPTKWRRHTLRIDGFASLHARQKPGEFISKPLTFTGKKLSLNFATSAAGSLRVEIQSVDGKPVPGFALEDCDEIFGDTLARTVTWKNQSDVSALAGKPVQLRMVMSDADLYSLKFEE